MKKKKEISQTMIVFSDNLREFRNEKKISQEKLAEKADLTASTISSYENAKKEPSIVNAKKIADVLGVTLDTLCGINAGKQYKKGLENMLIFCVLTVLEQFKFEVHVEGNEVTLTVSSDNDSPQYSSHEILEFFSEYEIIQGFSNHRGTNEMIETLIKEMEKKFKHLPGLPDYTSLQKYER